MKTFTVFYIYGVLFFYITDICKLKVRVLQAFNNFKRDVNSLITMEEIVEKYDKDKENMLIKAFKLGAL